MLKQKYTKEQIAAIDDLVAEFKTFAHTMGENERLSQARANLLNRNVVSLSARLKKLV